jgi:GT2 family glycosyltransferase
VGESGVGVGVGAIARNEGERLRRCLESLRGLGATVVYVDSGSTDGSVVLARSEGVEVVELDMSRPFTAARARNAGFARLLEVDPSLRYVQFLDGDCEVAEGWLDLAREALDARPRAAVVFGRRRERDPGRSVYNRLADLEWNLPIGTGRPGDTAGEAEAEACGGDAMMRVEAFNEVGGFDPSVPAGEEPELCARLRARGWSVVRLDADMTWHDAAMDRFGQWARRQVRTGYGGLDFSTRFGKPGADPFRRQISSARVWALGWPSALAAAPALGGLAAGPAAALGAALAVGLVPVAQALRIARRHRAAAGSGGTALAYGALTVLGKFFQAAGQALYLRDRAAGRHARLIEYKSDEPRPGTVAATSP